MDDGEDDYESECTEVVERLGSDLGELTALLELRNHEVDECLEGHEVQSGTSVRTRHALPLGRRRSKLREHGEVNRFHVKALGELVDRIDRRTLLSGDSDLVEDLTHPIHGESETERLFDPKRDLQEVDRLETEVFEERGGLHHLLFVDTPRFHDDGHEFVDDLRTCPDALCHFYYPLEGAWVLPGAY